MIKTIADLKVGDQVIFGRYAPMVWPGRRFEGLNAIPQEELPAYVEENLCNEIRWIKCRRDDGLLISRDVLDTEIAFRDRIQYGTPGWDAPPSWLNSAIRAWLNASDEGWHRPTEGATPVRYANCPGFLSRFLPEEIAALEDMSSPADNGSYSCDLVRLPDSAELERGQGETLSYFKKHGKTAMIHERFPHAYYDNRTRWYWTQTTGTYGNVRSISASGRLTGSSGTCGIRPMIRLNLMLPVEATGEEGVYAVSVRHEPVPVVQLPDPMTLFGF